MKLLRFIVAIVVTVFEVNAMPTFLDIKTCRESTTKGEAIFSMIPDGEIQVPYRLIADSAYDQTFKKIFSWDNITDGISGGGRIQSLLNSIFYPNVGEEGFKIRSVEQLPNESTKFGEKTPLGVLKFDIACRCSCYAEGNKHDVKIFDIEMQTGYEADFAGRLFDYGSSLRSINDHKPVIVLAFLNYVRGEKDESFATGLFYKDEQGNPTTQVDGVVDTQCICLPRKAQKLLNNEQIIIEGNVIGPIGREWLKLLSLRHWATPYKYSSVVRYVVPKYAEDSDPAIQSALTMLESVNDSDLDSYIKQESSAMAMLDGAKNDGILEQARNTAIRMLQDNVDINTILKYTNLSFDAIEGLRQQLQQ